MDRERERGGLSYVIIGMVTNILLKLKMYLQMIAFQFWTHSYLDSLALAQKKLLKTAKAVLKCQKRKRFVNKWFSSYWQTQMGVFWEKGLSIREKSLIDKTGLPKKVWQYCSASLPGELESIGAERVNTTSVRHRFTNLQIIFYN